jgi:4-carboxymuconolactone decarboxylase
MARLPLQTREFVIAEQPDAFERLDRDGQGALFDIHRVLMNAPNIFKRHMDFALELRHGVQLEPKLRELAILTVAMTASAQYELDHHWVLAIRAGVTDEQLRSLVDYATSAAFDARERAVMRFAEVSTRDVAIPQDVFDAAHCVLGDRQLTELLYQIGFYNMIARFEAAALLRTEDWFDRERGILREGMNS